MSLRPTPADVGEHELVLDVSRAHASSRFTYSVGNTSNFEWNPARRYLIPHYVWVNLTLGYRVVPAGLRDLSGPTAGLVAMLSPW